ncbi:S-methyl-5-thioribose kinase [Latilactobacillus fuchuensis]|uniref:S-methyl-5-thioribose kinase n=1 Tax=Latilactobacillus fuchuensis TaxID=164393 RepID=A0A2N9DWT4_9LACO|nr:S-methyl-5-thioribose kinase [Latilactobacillus fuchuensis]SPC39125.1 Methylthioribose kinase [Latilactobacillus fuchuensis]
MDYNKYFLLDEETVKAYTLERTDYFGDIDVSELSAKEISDGNINHIFRLEAKDKTLIVKQSGAEIRTSGRPLDRKRSLIESEILSIQRELCGEVIPKVFDYNKTISVIIMEDVSDFKSLRLELQKKRTFKGFSEEIAKYLADSLLPTTDLVLDRHKKKELVKEFINIELCDITEDLVLTEPYYNYKNRNIYDEELNDFVEQNLYKNEYLKANISELRNSFMNNAQALLHGDLHSGSIFINDSGIRVFDPEFGFYGPMGYDIGNVIGNLVFPYVVDKVQSKQGSNSDSQFTQWLGRTIEEIFDKTFDNMRGNYDSLVEFPLYKERSFKNKYIKDIESDTLGYAGTEIIRRTIGDSKVIEVTEIEDLNTKNLVWKVLIKIGINLILNRSIYHNGSEVMTDIDSIIDDLIKEETNL